MKTIAVNIEDAKVTLNNETCSFYEAGLYINDDNQRDKNGNYLNLTDEDEITEYLKEKYEEGVEVIFER